MSALLRRGADPPPPPAPPPRSPERQRLFQAQLALSGAVGQANRIEAARQKVDDELFDKLQPAARVARERLDEAREAAPELLVDQLLGEEAPAGEMTVADAEARLVAAERAVSEARQARRLLRAEAERAEVAIGTAKQALDAAVTAVVNTDPARAALIAEFDRCARRVLRCAQALKMLGVNQFTEAHGLRLSISIAPVAMGQVAFHPDPTWASAIAALRDDADAPLPGLPADDDGIDAKAAA